MNKARRCQLTAKDANILEVMLERRGHQDDNFTRLLRQKVAMASVVLFDGVDPRAATINSRVEYSIDGDRPYKRILVYGGENAYPGMTLPISTIRGLALLGLVAPGSVICDDEDGRTEQIRLLRVLYQPEAWRWSARERGGSVGAAPRRACDIVLLQARVRTQVGGAESDDDDPGPAAA